MLRANQRDGYALLMKAAAEAIIELARDPRFVGATVGVLAVLHTWTQQLLYHPHVHCLVSGGGVSQDGGHWLPARKGFLVPVKALARLVRGTLRAAFQKSRPDLIIPEGGRNTIAIDMVVARIETEHDFAKRELIVGAGVGGLDLEAHGNTDERGNGNLKTPQARGSIVHWQRRDRGATQAGRRPGSSRAGG